MAMGPRARHCGRFACRCSHELCDHGWCDVVDAKGDTISTRPCLACREDLAAAVLEARDRGELQRNLARHRAGESLTPA